MFVIRKSFPEWRQLDSELESAIIAAEKMMTSFDKAHGKHATLFCQRLAPCVSEVIFTLEELVVKNKENMRGLHSCLPRARADLNKIKALEERIEQDRDAFGKLLSLHDRARDNLELYSAKLEIHKDSPESPAYIKAKLSYDTAKESYDTINVRMEEGRALLSKKEEMYRKRLYECALMAFKILCEARLQHLENYEKFGRALMENSRELPLGEDPGIDMLLAELSSLEQYV